MQVETPHPVYNHFVSRWEVMRDTYAGGRAVKAKGETYLPMPMSMVLDGKSAGQEGRRAYDAYRARAAFHGYVRMAVDTLIGRMHQEPATIELPETLEPLRENATADGEGLQLLLRQINAEQLVSGRLGVMADLPATFDSSGALPYLTTYPAEAVINWDDGGHAAGSTKGLRLVVLNESEFRRKASFEWETVRRFRVLSLGPIDPRETDLAASRYGVAVYSPLDDGTFAPDALVEPSYRGRPLDVIPFAIINPADTKAAPSVPPLLQLADVAIGIYQMEADYRQALHMQGQDTLVVIGGMDHEGEDLRVGAGARIMLAQGGDAKYIGVSSEGLPEMRTALENDKRHAMTMAGQLVDVMGGTEQSGEALRTRVGASVAALPQIADAGAEGLQRVLRIVAEWVGANPAQVVVTANKDFGDIEGAAKELIDLMTARNMGAPLSLASIHERMQDLGLTEMELDQELTEVEGEDPVLGAAAPPPAAEGGDDQEGDE